MTSTAIAVMEPARHSEQDHLRNAIQSLVLDGLSSPHTRRAYEQALEEFLIWLCADTARPFTKAVVQRYRTELQAKDLAPASINIRISAIRRLALEAGDNGLLAPEIAAGIGRVKGAKRSGVRLGRWLTCEQAEALLRAPDPSTVKGARDRAILAVLLGAGLRRSEAAALTFEHLQQREERWVIADLIGKHGRIRTVPIPDWVDAAIRRWAAAVGLGTGRVFRALDKRGRVCSQRLSAQSVFNILKTYADKTGFLVSPHDARRTWAHCPQLFAIRIGLAYARSGPPRYRRSAAGTQSGGTSQAKPALSVPEAAFAASELWRSCGERRTPGGVHLSA